MAGQSGRWGFHELDPRWASRLVALADIRAGDLVVDIGAGRGVVTAALVQAGARVVAVELHPGRAAGLRDRFADAPVTVVRADATDLRLPRRPFSVVANPPFGIATAVVRRLTSRGSRLERAALVLPGWAVHRFTARPAGLHPRTPFTMGPGPGIPPRAFRPPATAPARVLTIARRVLR